MRPIDADELSKDIEEAYKKAEEEGWKPGDVARILCAIVAAPTLDIEPVRHGRWLDPDYIYIGVKRCVCSLCKDDEYWIKRYLTTEENYCPNCGARMDLEERE